MYYWGRSLDIQPDIIIDSPGPVVGRLAYCPGTGIAIVKGGLQTRVLIALLNPLDVSSVVTVPRRVETVPGSPK